ncbi:MAG: IclR family transcriptional regulator [Anaerolineae bacterium]|nr:IclR family transcriptional regulator [Anaerolineae bacterium]
MNEIQSLARGLDILAILGKTRDGATISEVAAQLAIDKSSASRLLYTLVQHGFARRDETTHRYHLGAEVIQLSRSMFSRMPLRETIRPYLRRLMEQTGESAHLALPAQGMVLYVDQVESRFILKVETFLGLLAPPHTTAAGKVLLAHGCLGVPGRLAQFTLNTITDRQPLQQHLEQVRHNGYAHDDEEFALGVRGIAVPVIDHHGRVVAAIGIAGPITRMTFDVLPRLTEKVVQVGNAVMDSFVRA